MLRSRPPGGGRPNLGDVSALVDELTARLDRMVDDLASLVTIESPSGDQAGLEASAHRLGELTTELLGHPPTIVPSPAGPHVHWQGPGVPRVLLLGHHDTVHPRGSLASWPFSVADGLARGPGVFDMKGGIVQALHALSLLDSLDGVELLWTADEEVGSQSSRELLETRALACGATLVLEPSFGDGALKVARKGTGTFELQVHGRSAHAGNEPEKGVNALIEAATQILRIASLGDPARGTTVTPTVAHAGTSENTVPDQARVRIDVRVTSADEARRVTNALRALTPTLADARLELVGRVGRPPMPREAGMVLFGLACEVAHELELPTPTGVEVGGGSDGNFTAARGVPTLDGLGAVGGALHTFDEHLRVDTMPGRGALVAGLVRRLQHRS
jgi:glutamate carboxypeptidase